jgi:UDP-2,4-diacetamido-2,4,6-trideoxy-beta-L-altropyranose hydrolase
MHLYIRADADSKMGTGHIMRCIALAQTWQDRGGEVTFISHCDSEFLKQRINDEGISLIPIDRICPDPSDIKTTLSILKNDITDQKTWLVTDGYHFNPEYQKAIQDEGISLLVIDDMNHLPHYHADIILNQNINALDLKYHCDKDITLLLGTSYVLLRREFLKYRDFKRQVPDRAKNILVTLGGADPENVTLNVIEALKLLNEPDIAVKIIIGPANPHQDILHQAIASARFEAELLVNPYNMPELMAWADLAISAAGSTCWELMFMALPSIILVLAENQSAIARYLMDRKTVVNLGWMSECTREHINYACKSLMRDNVFRKHLSAQSSMLISGQGPSLVVESIQRGSLNLRDVTDLDRELIWHWANDEETRKASYSQAHISLDEHIRWFDSVRIQKNHRFYIANDGCKMPVGQIRFAIDGKEAVVSFSIARESRGHGYGMVILIKAAKKLFNKTDIEQISAYVKSENEASSRVFQKAGFRMAEEVDICGVKSRKMILSRVDLI